MSSRSDKSKQSRSEKKRPSSKRSHSSKSREEDIPFSAADEQNDINMQSELPDSDRIPDSTSGDGHETEPNSVGQMDRKLPAMRELIRDSKEFIEKLNRLSELANRELEELENSVQCQSTGQLKSDELDKEIIAKTEETQKLKDDLQNEIDTLRQQNESLQQENETLKKEVDQHKNMTDDRYKDYDDIERRLDRKESELRRAKSDMDSLERQLDDRNDDIRKLKDDFRRDTDNLQREIDSLKAQQSQQGNKTENPSDYDDIKQRLECKETELHATVQELEAVKTRMTTSTEETVTGKNPNTTDSGDMNTQEELSERYKELYENQWSDAYDVLEKRIGDDENKIISILLAIFTKTNEYCTMESQLQMKEIQKVITQSEKVRKLGVPDNVVKYIKDCRKASSAEGMREIYKNYQTWMRSVPFPQARYAKLVKDYTDECFEICWLMAIQDPPIILAPEPRQGETNQPETYTTYIGTNTTVEYLVWPALLLHVDGPVLATGVVQTSDKPPTAPEDETDGDMTKRRHNYHREDDIGNTTMPDDGMLVSKRKRVEWIEDDVSDHGSDYPDSARDRYAYGASRNYVLKDLRHARFSDGDNTRGYDQTHMPTHRQGPYTPHNWDVTKYLLWKKQYGEETARQMMGEEYDRIETYFS